VFTDVSEVPAVSIIRATRLMMEAAGTSELHTVYDIFKKKNRIVMAV
jgi:hypothetical protein